MKKVILAVLIVALMGQVSYAKDVTIKAVPEGITDKTIAEFVKLLVKRYETKLLETGSNLEELKPVTQKQIDDAKKVISDYEKANDIEAIDE